MVGVRSPLFHRDARLRSTHVSRRIRIIYSHRKIRVNVVAVVDNLTVERVFVERGGKGGSTLMFCAPFIYRESHL